jgi:predicted transglutaminase-like cysteine proteinase
MSVVLKYFLACARVTFAILGVAGFLLSTPPVFALEAPALKYFKVRQEISSNGGVLVSRPNPEDEAILSLLTVNQIRTLEDYTRWLQKNIVYEKDASRDDWATPQKTLRQKRGDCEDFAFLNSSVVRMLGFEPHVLAMIDGNRAHAVCAFERDGHFIWIDNQQIKNTTTSSLKGLAHQINLLYRYSRILEFDPTTKKWQPLLQGS